MRHRPASGLHKKLILLPGGQAPARVLLQLWRARCQVASGRSSRLSRLIEQACRTSALRMRAISDP